MPLDALTLSEDLIRCPSITPTEGGALDLLQDRLEAMGFTCWRLPLPSAHCKPSINQAGPPYFPDWWNGNTSSMP